MTLVLGSQSDHSLLIEKGGILLRGLQHVMAIPPLLGVSWDHPAHTGYALYS